MRHFYLKIFSLQYILKAQLTDYTNKKRKTFHSGKTKSTMKFAITLFIVWGLIRITKRKYMYAKMTESWYMIYIQGGPNSFFAAWTGDISETLPFCCAEEDCSGSWLGRARAEPTTVSETNF